MLLPFVIFVMPVVIACMVRDRLMTPTTNGPKMVGLVFLAHAIVTYKYVNRAKASASSFAIAWFSVS
jgi:hypothetical protein